MGPGPPPVVSGISPREGPTGNKMAIQGKNLGISPQDVGGVFINDCDCLLIYEWKTDWMIVALAPAKTSKGDIVIVTASVWGHGHKPGQDLH